MHRTNTLGGLMTDTTEPSARASLGAGSILSESFSLTMRNFLGMLLLIIIPLVVTFGLSALLIGPLMFEMMSNPLAAEQAMLSDPSGFIIGQIAVTIVAMLAFSFFYAGAIKLIFDAKLGGRGSIGAAFSAGFSGMIRLFVMTIVFMILFLVVYMIGAVIIGAVAGAAGAGAGSEGLAIVLAIVFGLAVVIGLIYFVAMFLPFASVVVVESSWFAAFSRSAGLTSGYRWSIVGLCILFLLAMIVIMVILGVVMYGVLLAGAVGAVLAGILYVVALIIIYGAMVAMITLVYARLREIKEGTTIESLSEVFA